MSAITILALFATAFAVAQTNVPPVVLRSEALYQEKIVDLVLTNASLEESVSMIRKIWEHHYPNDTFPVGLTNYSVLTDETGRTPRPLIAIHLKNIPYIEALHYIAVLANRRLIETRGMVQLEEPAWIKEDWHTCAYEMTPILLERLGLTLSSVSAVPRASKILPRGVIGMADTLPLD